MIGTVRPPSPISQSLIVRAVRMVSLARQPITPRGHLSPEIYSLLSSRPHFHHFFRSRQGVATAHGSHVAGSCITNPRNNSGQSITEDQDAPASNIDSLSLPQITIQRPSVQQSRPAIEVIEYWQPGDLTLSSFKLDAIELRSTNYTLSMGALGVNMGTSKPKGSLRRGNTHARKLVNVGNVMNYCTLIRTVA